MLCIVRQREAVKLSGDLTGIDAYDVSFINLVKHHYPKLSLPNYQRSYVWDKSKILTFLEDLIINDKAPGIPNMFAGSVLMLREIHESIDYDSLRPEILKSYSLEDLNDIIVNKLHLRRKTSESAAIKVIEKARPSSKIIDGQQRITTCFILAIILHGKLLLVVKSVINLHLVQQLSNLHLDMLCDMVQMVQMYGIKFCI